MDAELRMVYVTASGKEEAERIAKELHSYSCPCVVAVPIVYSDEEYAKWVMNETK